MDGIKRNELYNLKRRKEILEIEREYRDNSKTETYIFNGYTQIALHAINENGKHKIFRWKDYGLTWVVKSKRNAFGFNDWGTYGICNDPYCLHDKGKELKMFLNSGIEFDSGWHGFRKEIQSMRIRREFNKGITISVHQEIDDAIEQCDLIMDCLNEDESEIITDEMIEEIQKLLSKDMDFYTEKTLSETIEENSTFEEVLKKATELANTCDELLHNCYLNCLGTTLYVLYGKPKDTKFIEERIEKEMR